MAFSSKSGIFKGTKRTKEYLYLISNLINGRKGTTKL